MQEIAAILPYYDVDRSAVQIIGPALWADPASGSGAVQGAWYAAPDNSTRSDLERDYAAKYGAHHRRWRIWPSTRLQSPR